MDANVRVMLLGAGCHSVLGVRQAVAPSFASGTNLLLPGNLTWSAPQHDFKENAKQRKHSLIK